MTCVYLASYPIPLQTMTRELYDHAGMRRARRRAVERAMRAKRWGLVLGTLGRQGSPYVLQRLEKALKQRGRKLAVCLGTIHSVIII